MEVVKGHSRWPLLHPVLVWHSNFWSLPGPPTWILGMGQWRVMKQRWIISWKALPSLKGHVRQSLSRVWLSIFIPHPWTNHVGLARWEDHRTKSDWWFGTFYVFPYIGNDHPNWLIFFRGVETTNQKWCIFPLPCLITSGILRSHCHQTGRSSRWLAKSLR